MNYRGTYVEVDLDVLRSNYLKIQDHVGPEVMVMPVIKANGFGHGAINCAKEYVDIGAKYLAVATVDEAIELREAEIELPILIFGHVYYHQIERLCLYNFTFTVYDIEFAQRLSLYAKKTNTVQKVHINYDTGMGRLGFRGEQSTIEAIQAIVKLPNIAVEGIYSHLSSADEKDTSFSLYQLGLFINLLDKLNDKRIKFKYRHLSNSAATISLPSTHFNLVRPGISLYGAYPVKYMKEILPLLKPCMTFATTIIHLKNVEVGEYIGYNRKFKAKCKMKVATLPVGYADGYKRALSNRGVTLVKGQKCSVIGNVCMDQMMIDVTHIKGVSLFDKVVLFGAGLPVELLCNLTDTIAHDYFTTIGHRVPRKYIRGGKEQDNINYLINT